MTLSSFVAELYNATTLLHNDSIERKQQIMPRVVFTANLKRHTDCPEVVVAAKTVLEALKTVFAQKPTLESYILDDQDRLRKHMVIFVDGESITDRENLSDTVQEDSEIYVMQALSGG